MSEKHGFQEHWLNIDSERMDRYETMYQWNPATEHYYEAADIRPNLVIADFGCGPGYAAIEFANRVGEKGHVHALDINAAFINRTKKRAESLNLDDRITAHLLTNRGMPLPDSCLDRIIARNTIIYVPNPVEIFSEFKRTLRPEGIAHAIEGDWRLTAVKPISTEDWQAIIQAASWAWPHPEMGRNLYGVAKQAGFEEVNIQVLTSPDTVGRLKPMIDTVAGYAKESGDLEPEFIEDVLEAINVAISEQSFLALAPQFIVTARA